MNDAVRRALAQDKPVKVTPLAEAADRSRNSLYEAIKRGEVQSVRIGRAIRVPARRGPPTTRGQQRCLKRKASPEGADGATMCVWIGV